MKNLKITSLTILVLLTINIYAQNPVKLKRADCFFGVHFDLHATEEITNAGESLTETMIDTFLTKVKPDFIQIDCKGHPGITSYPTKVGYHVKGFQKDPLRLFRDVTNRHNVGLYMHYSGVWDTKAVTEHPDWAIQQANGEWSKTKTSFASPYLDKLMIPELKELSDYGVDGAWIDGECWAVEPDYRSEIVALWKQKTGKEAPKEKSTPEYYEYMAFIRSLFHNHLNKYVDAIHQYDSDFQITSNWSYSSLMPEPVDANIDFISGDVTPQNGVFRSAFEARCIAPQGKPWDLMAWGFSWNGKDMPMSNKSAVQLKQEAAEIMAMGGGVQFYYTQNRDLSIRPWIGNTVAEIAAFCRERQEFVHKAQAIPQVALIYPASYLNENNAPFSPNTNALQGMLYALLDNQLCTEILMEHHLKGKIGEYPLVILPECNSMNEDTKRLLAEYVANGGNLLVIGANTTKLFKEELKVQTAEITEAKQIFIKAANRLGAVRSKVAEITPDLQDKVLSRFLTGNDFRDESQNPSAFICKLGKGNIGAVCFDAGSVYQQYKSMVIRDFTGEIVQQLFNDPVVKTKGSKLVHVAGNTKNGKTYINLINVAGEHTNQSAIGYDQVPALHDLTVSFSSKKKPSKIVLQPGGKELGFNFENGVSEVKVPEIEIHSILEIVQ